MKIYRVEFPLLVFDDEFEPGKCSKCPLKRVEGHETANRTWEEKISCKIDYVPATCPVRSVKKGE